MHDANLTLPAYGGLPDIPLYMDQVVYVVNGVMAAIEPWSQGCATPSTVNSYVKAKLLPAPVKKKYGREQIARLIMIYTLKRALSIGEIALLLGELYSGRSEEEAYALFADALRGGKEGCFELLEGAAAACRGKLTVERIAAAAADKAPVKERPAAAKERKR